ncbi:hypothetical protein SLA2020_288650 [Shorea laevis]
MESSSIDFNFERGVDEEEAVAVDVGLCGAAIFIIIVCCTGFQLAFFSHNRSSRCGNIGMEVNIGKFQIHNLERQGNEGSKGCSVISTELLVSLLTSTEESLLHHPLRLQQLLNLIWLRDGKNGTDAMKKKRTHCYLICTPKHPNLKEKDT